MKKVKKLIRLISLGLIGCFIFTGCDNPLKGDSGSNGKSAYEIWLDLGNEGTEEDFIKSLKGKNGKDTKSNSIIHSYINENGNLILVYEDETELNVGKVVGQNGIAGIDGKSAYQIWLEAGNEGDEEAFLASLIGEQGPQGIQGEQGPKGDTGATGPQGIQGENGTDATLPTCEHTLSEIVIKEPTCKDEGLAISICTKNCGSSFLTTLDKNNEHMSIEACSEQVIEATCTTDGYLNKVCSCGYIVQSTKTEDAHHSFTDTLKVTKEPTLNNVGELSCYCSACKKDIVIDELPILNSQDYTIETISENSSCTTPGIQKYTLKQYPQFSFTVETEVQHKYNGKVMDLDRVYYPEEVETIIGNYPLKCNESQRIGTFKCDECGLSFILYVIDHHKYSDETGNCETCGATKLDIILKDEET